MSYEAWVNSVRNAEKASVISGKVRKIHYKFPDGKEMVEEYSMETGVVLRRAWKKAKDLIGESKWELELGEDPKPIENQGGFLVKESAEEPILSKRITKRNIEWRIRNLPYTLETYSVSANTNDRCLVVRTTNKKYYKKIMVPELDRCNIPLEQGNITTHHQYNTLIITYRKPEVLCEMEAAVLRELQNVETETDMDDLLQGLLAK